MKIVEKNKALDLRRQGKTFSEILKETPVSKTSLSYWLRDIRLTNKQLSRIAYKNNKIKQKFIKFNALRRKQADDKKKIILRKATDEIDYISERELSLIGIALYWAEGYKKSSWKTVNFTNSDPEMIKLMMRWFRRICKIPNTKFRIRIQCHDTDNVEEAKEYWSGVTDIPLVQFTKPYVRISPSSKKRMGALSPYGICNLRISDVSLLTKIKGWINGLKALSSSLV